MSDKRKVLKDTFISSIILMMPRMVYRGVILYFCWLWFIVPVFFLPVIPFWYAIPISGLVSLLTFEKIGAIQNRGEAWLNLGYWTIGATVFFVSAFLMHILTII